VARLKTHSLAAHQLLHLSSVEFEAAMSSSSEWREVNSQLATFFLCLIDKEKPYGKSFYQKAIKHPEILESGYAIGSYLIASTEPKTGKELEERLHRVQSDPYFSMGMSELQAAEAAGRLESDWSLTVAGRAGINNDLLRTLIQKFPASLKADAEKYESEINESEVLGRELRWDFEQMTSILAVLLRRKPVLGQPEPPSFPCVNATEQRGRSTCPCCGQQGHVARDCPTVCTVCNEKSCPGNAGNACIVCTAVDIPATVKDATKPGRPIPDWCHERLVNAQTR
jgi:hypothetical protein